MWEIPTTAALLLLATALAFAAYPAAAQKGAGGPPLPTQCRFGWVPITFDRALEAAVGPSEAPKAAQLPLHSSLRVTGIGCCDDVRR
jgi:hypothetical protein